MVEWCGEWWIRKDLEGSDHGLEDSVAEFERRKWERPQRTLVTIAEVPDKIRTKQILNAIVEHYRYANLLNNEYEIRYIQGNS
jgi:hypothetical protein